MRIGLSFDEGTPKYRLYLGALLAAAEQAGLQVIPIWLAGKDRAFEPYHLETLDGIIFTGGADVEPARYGFSDNQGFCRAYEGRDEIELAMMKRTFARRVPMLAICRGMQLLNVHRGGTLTPHLATAVDHRLRDDERHDVQVESGSTLHRLVHTTEAGVTSSHHQAVNRLGRGLEATAWHRDRTIEAIGWRDPMRKPWMTAVQWHPERMALPEPLAGRLYLGFLQAVSARAS